MLLSEATLRKMLPQWFRVDQEIARETQAGGCRHCGGKLDVSHYRRKPRGWPVDAPEDARLRFSFCCRVEGCRRRATPASLRFLGRAVYLAIVVVSAGLWLASGARDRRRAGERRGHDRRTWHRWLGRWQDFAASRSGRELHAQLGSPSVPPRLALLPRLWATLVDRKSVV